jgi:hypothetical protein
MRVNNLMVDLLQGQASVSLVEQPESSEPNRPRFTSINVNVPIDTPGNESEGQLKRIAVEQAKRALEEALRTLQSVQL